MSQISGHKKQIAVTDTMVCVVILHLRVLHDYIKVNKKGSWYIISLCSGATLLKNSSRLINS